MIKKEKFSINLFMILGITALILLPLLITFLKITLTKNKQITIENKCYDNSDPYITKVVNCSR